MNANSHLVERFVFERGMMDEQLVALSCLWFNSLGTPRFEQDGALGFDVTTSNPKYDKIFGSLSYVFGDTTRGKRTKYILIISMI